MTDLGERRRKIEPDQRAQIHHFDDVGIVVAFLLRFFERFLLCFDLGLSRMRGDRCARRQNEHDHEHSEHRHERHDHAHEQLGHVLLITFHESSPT